MGNSQNLLRVFKNPQSSFIDSMIFPCWLIGLVNMMFLKLEISDDHDGRIAVFEFFQLQSIFSHKPPEQAHWRDKYEKHNG